MQLPGIARGPETPLEFPEGEPAPPSFQPVVPLFPHEPASPTTLNGLVAYWPLDEGQGAVSEDRSGNSLQAGVKRGAWIPGVRNSALWFDGQGGYVDLGTTPLLHFGDGQPFTLAGWIATAADSGTVCSFRHSAHGAAVLDLLLGGGQLQAVVRSDRKESGEARVSGGKVNDRQWHHFALVRQADGSVELYLDGTLQKRGKGPNSAGPITTDYRALASERYWVLRSPGMGNRYYAGAVDEFCVFIRALDPAEILSLAGR